MKKKTNNEVKKIVKREIKRKILKLTEGVIDTAMDLVLCELVFLANFTSSTTRSEAYKAAFKTNQDLENIDKKAIKNALYNLKKRGLIKSMRLVLEEEIISDQGRKRLASIIPVYQKQRTWDKRLYLITYDISEKEKTKRNFLYNFLKQLHCAMLQKSVWLSVYNPKNLIKEFINKEKIEGNILVSDLGSDGNIGGENLKDLLIEVYNLEEINEDYDNFCNQFKVLREISFKKRRELIYKFLSIMKNDPQLPFELLPLYWQGDRAYLLYKKLLKEK